jgi:hypothetical protein
MGEARAWREAAKLAESDVLAAAAMDRSMQKFQEALQCLPPGKLDEAPAAAKPTESRRPAAQRSKTITLNEPGSRRG